MSNRGGENAIFGSKSPTTRSERFFLMLSSMGKNTSLHPKVSAKHKVFFARKTKIFRPFPSQWLLPGPARFLSSQLAALLR